MEINRSHRYQVVNPAGEIVATHTRSYDAAMHCITLDRNAGIDARAPKSDKHEIIDTEEA